MGDVVYRLGVRSAASRQYRMALHGNAPVAFSRVKRSSAATAWIPSLVSRAAAESKPWTMRYSRAERCGNSRFLNGTLLCNPLMPSMFSGISDCEAASARYCRIGEI